MSTTGEGTVYLIKLASPLGNEKHQARYYLGWCAGDVQERLKEHRAGSGARMLAHAVARGIAFDVVRTWPGGRDLERRLKRWHKHRALDPDGTRRAT